MVGSFLLTSQDPVRRQMILLRLIDALERQPTSSDDPAAISAWMAEVDALFKKVNSEHTARARLRQIGAATAQSPLNEAKEQLPQAIAELKLELELDGKTEIGDVYEAGQAYRYYADLRAILDAAEDERFVIDPYFNGEVFNKYFGTSTNTTDIRILCDLYHADVITYAAQHVAGFDTTIEVRKSKNMHDRVIALDRDECVVLGGSIKDGGKKPTYVLPLQPELAAKKIAIYESMWQAAKRVFPVP